MRTASLQPPSRATKVSRTAVVAGLAALALSVGNVGTGNTAPALAGYRDFSFGAATTAPTAKDEQSKVWFNDGIWWGVLYNTVDFHIDRLDWASQTWSDTGTLVDNRENVRSDALWDGTNLYVVTAGLSETSSTSSAKIRRFSYSSTTKSYTLDSGFPVTITTGGTAAITIDKDTTGKIWAAYTQSSQVMVTHTTTSDTAWVTPFVLPATGQTGMLSQDEAAIVAYNSKIGIMWSNQATMAFYFAIHTDGAADNVWQSTVAHAAPEEADNHMNLKALNGDSAGQVFAAVKTSKNGASDPLYYLLVLKNDGTWSSYVFGRVADNHTRAQIVIDSEHRQLYMFATSPCCNGGTIYYKKTSLDAISFPSGVGTPFIQSSTDTHINNVSTTKQRLTSTTGLVAVAGDDTSDFYLHNAFVLAPDTTAPDTTIDSGPSGTVNTNTATFTFSSSEPNSTFECSLDAAAFTACTSPKTYTGLADGSHTFQVQAKDPASNLDPTPASSTWTVDTTAPDTTIDSGPSGTVTSDTATFTFSSSESGSTFECRLDAASFTPCSSPKTYGGLAEGSHTFEVRALDAAGHVDSSPASRTWIVDIQTVLTFSPAADARVAEAKPTTNYATSGLRTDGGSDLDVESYLRFTVSGISGTILSVKLRLFNTNGTVDGPAVYTTMNSWTETGITWNTRSPRTSGAQDDKGSSVTNTWVEWDVVPFVTADGIYSFVLAQTSSDSASFNSREASTNRPELVVVTDVDTTAPETTIDSGPSGTVNSSSATFTFSASEPGSTFECRLDGASFSACSSPKTYSGLADGSHTFEARAKDPAGNVDPSPAGRTWAVDTTAPETTIDSGPSGTVNSSSATFTFSASEPGSTFECRLDAASFTACSSPKTYSGLADGSHTFEARAKDPAGNVDPSPAGRTWAVDASGPTTLTLAAEADARVAAATPTTNYATSFLRADGGSDPGVESYLRFTVSGLSGTIVSVTLRLFNTNGTVDGPAVYTTTSSWTETGITWNTRPARTSGPQDDKASIATSTWVEWDLTPFVTGNGTYDFVLATSSSDGIDFNSREATGNTPQLVVVEGASDTTPPDTTVDSGPSGISASSTATFTFSSSEPGSTFACQLDGGGFAVCVSPKTYTGLADGSHTFEVKATDSAGNTDPSPASRTWTVNTSSPTTLTFAAEADARVEAGNLATNFGGDTSLIADLSPNSESYVRFAVSGVSGSVASAKLRIFVYNGTNDGPALYTADSGWTETAVTWDTKPARTSGVIANQGSIAAGVWVEYDVTAVVTGNGTYTFNFGPESSDGTYFNSREAPSNAPALVVTFG